MRIGLVLTPFSDLNLARAAQVGVSDVVFYDGTASRRFPDFTELLHVRTRVENAGMRLSVLETFLPMDRLVFGKAGRDADIEAFKRSLDAMGRAGVEVLCYDWMPPNQEVVRTSYTTRIRGGALTSSFDAGLYARAPLTAEGVTTDEQMWESLEYFLRRVAPAAEAAEVRLAMHPDDPPLSPLAGLARIMRGPAAFDRLFSLAPAEWNGMTLCQGCFSTMGEDVPALIRRFRDRIHFAHFRDVRGNPAAFTEVFQDEGQTDMAASMRAYREIGFRGVIRPDHVPMLAGEEGIADGYTMLGRLFAVGYMRGLMEATARL